MKQTVEFLVKGIGNLGLGVAKALLADLSAVARNHGFNQINEGTSLEPGVLNGEFAYEPGIAAPPEKPVAKAKAKAKPKAKAKAKVAKKTAKAKGTAKKK